MRAVFGGAERGTSHLIVIVVMIIVIMLMIMTMIIELLIHHRVVLFADGIGTPDPNPRNLGKFGVSNRL